MMKDINCCCKEKDCKRVIRIIKDEYTPKGMLELFISDKDGTFLLNSGIYVDENLINLTGEF